MGERALAPGEGDAFVPEAEWCLTFPEGVERYLDAPDMVTADTPVRLQGLIEGKWLNRLVGTGEWSPASLHNNLLASGPGLLTTLGALESGGGDEVVVEYRYRHEGQDHARRQRSTLSDLRGQNIVDLVRAIVRHCGETGQRVEWIDLSAMGVDAAVVNEPARLAAATSIPLPASGRPDAGWFRQVVDRAVADILADGLAAVPGDAMMLEVRDAAGSRVGQGRLLLQ